MDFHVYYKLINDMGQTGPINNRLVPGEIVAFPPGFKMLAGKSTTQIIYKIILHFEELLSF